MLTGLNFFDVFIELKIVRYIWKIFFNLVWRISSCFSNNKIWRLLYKYWHSPVSPSFRYWRRRYHRQPKAQATQNSQNKRRWYWDEEEEAERGRGKGEEAKKKSTQTTGVSENRRNEGTSIVAWQALFFRKIYLTLISST